jgi:hypothetical protein
MVVFAGLAYGVYWLRVRRWSIYIRGNVPQKRTMRLKVIPLVTRHLSAFINHATRKAATILNNLVTRRHYEF